ncbi:MAG: hypothetical protein A2651_04155 [Candidatus Yanofskybacteria bacterium RIFCSPHIGHO2_01_FULL_42_12]|uniref:50S ribosomal protein L35 n=1 Tax=Candidatus Yanofskybacteria bacterium RIFCSPLOWO2_01_FULL_42_49 TaxID=1802694 RepID=A0A1F8GB24_9BACT|nr:MAG: hypothetical protein A2651_04155 [Candidatus Yanofskybacteria bacterium RIFCSPHIGHO2_01_FULL_42_12]OGN22584.1 MAG: hypothetical protein A2918_02380 [Candidatus Yanofskybacteria bacterium RIFCSPLOWO2_01_FULL_42_49]
MTHGAKTKKALFKRVKITGRNKIMKRPPGQNHFNAKDSGSQTRQKRGDKVGPHELIKSTKSLLTRYL